MGSLILKNTLLRVVVVSALYFFISPANASVGAEELKKCLADFGGIAWKLPYKPDMHIHSCDIDKFSSHTSLERGDGRHSVELMAFLSFGIDERGLPSSVKEAAIKTAVYEHFDALFRRHGYRQIEVGYGEVRDIHEIRLRSILSRQKSGKEKANEIIASEKFMPPIPYVNLARYVHASAGNGQTLTFETQGANMWLITLESTPVVANKPSGDQK